MKFAALVSGGKDSIYNIIECVRNGHELVACVHLGAPLQNQEESYMYQTAASEVLPTLVEECLGVPLVLYHRKGTSCNTSLVYETTTESDEVEDLYAALEETKERFPEIQAVSSGAILSTYQRVRIEHVCSRLGLTSLSYLWRLESQHDLLPRMLEDGIVAVVVKTACPPGLVPQKHLNKTLDALYHSGLFEKLHRKYQFHMCGEGGEYESLVLDCPLYKQTLVLDETEIVETDDGVGVLSIKCCHAEPKEDDAEPKEDDAVAILPRKSTSSSTEPVQLSENSAPAPTPRLQFLPHVRRMKGGLLHLSEIISPTFASSNENASEADLAVQEALAIFKLLEMTLIRHGATAQDVLMVHLYLSEISHFARINAHYRNFFGTLQPPSRSCVAIGKQSGRRVMLDCLVQCGSGQYMRSRPTDNPYAKAAQLTTTSSLRQVLHVQSISYWAPVCVGPYSQVNTLRSGLHFLAGQIGLVPATMKLQEMWTRQLEQSWTNVASVLDALDGGSLDILLSCLVYVSDKVCKAGNEWPTVESICRRQISINGSIVPGLVDSTATSSDSLYGGYEDEGTWREMMEATQEETDTCSIPLLLVSIPEMPVGALAEVEVICATQRAASCLNMKSQSFDWKEKRTKAESSSALSTWDTGHDFSSAQQSAVNEGVDIYVSACAIGHGCAAMAIVSATVGERAAPNMTEMPMDIDELLDSMFEALLESDLILSSGLSEDEIVHVRLYHTGASDWEDTRQSAHDEARLRSSLHAAIRLRCAIGDSKRKRGTNAPAYSVVPVQAMKVIPVASFMPIEATTVLAMQVLFADPVHMETEMWIHHGREA